MLSQLSTVEWMASFGFICCLTYISGWLAAGLMGRSGYGHIGNWLLLFIGTYTAIYVFNLYGYQFGYDPLFTLAYISAGAAGFFIFMCLTKRVFAK